MSQQGKENVSGESIHVMLRTVPPEGGPGQRISAKTGRFQTMPAPAPDPEPAQAAPAGKAITGRFVAPRSSSTSSARLPAVQPPPAATPRGGATGRFTAPAAAGKTGKFAAPAAAGATGRFHLPGRATGTAVSAGGMFKNQPQTPMDGPTVLVLLACGGFMVFGILAAIKTATSPAPPPLPTTSVAVRDVGSRGVDSGLSAPYGFAAPAAAEEAPPPPPVIYDGPLIKDPDGQWYVAKSAADLVDRYRFDPRRASRVVDHGQPSRKYISFAPNVLVKAHPELLVMVDLGVKLRSDYSKQSGRGCVHQSPKRTREQMEALTKRRAERQQRKGEVFGVDYCEDNEAATAVQQGKMAPAPKPGQKPVGQVDTEDHPEAAEEQRQVWKDKSGKTRSYGPPAPKKQSGTPAPKH